MSRIPFSFHSCFGSISMFLTKTMIWFFKINEPLYVLMFWLLIQFTLKHLYFQKWILNNDTRLEWKTMEKHIHVLFCTNDNDNKHAIVKKKNSFSSACNKQGSIVVCVSHLYYFIFPLGLKRSWILLPLIDFIASGQSPGQFLKDNWLLCSFLHMYYRSTFLPFRHLHNITSGRIKPKHIFLLHRKSVKE